MKAHVNEGYDIIKDKDIDSRVKEACLLHHENVMVQAILLDLQAKRFLILQNNCNCRHL